MKLKIALFSLLLSLAACNTGSKSNKETTDSLQDKSRKFKYWNWVTVGNKKTDAEFEAHFKKLKKYNLLQY